MSLEDALLKRLKSNVSTGCWEIDGYADKDGYGQVSNRRAHRLAYELFVGKIPVGMVVCHKCDNPRCCNPDHLFIGTQKENIADMIFKGRRALRFGVKNTQNKLNEEQVIEIFKSNQTQRQIAEKFKIDQSTVSNIKTGKIWGWLKKDGDNIGA